LAAALARPLRQSRLADDLGLVAAYGAVGCARSADRDLDFPQSTPAITAVTDGQLRPVGTAAVRIATVGLPAVRLSPVTGTVGIADIWISGTIGQSKWWRRTE
jgi:hypothetical protein